MKSMNQFNYDHLRNLAIGTVDYVSPNEIKVVLDTSAPQNIALNTGSPSLFPRINGFVLIPNEVGALVGLISWIGVENSQFPKRKGYKDFDLIDLPFPLRRMSITPMGTLKQEGKIEDKIYKLERGVYCFPSIGDTVILPTDIQLKSIVENREKNSVVKIGIAPIAGDVDVKINPDKFFGRHVAILGNTGSGKSCSVAGAIRWSLEEAGKQLTEEQKLNCRFIILDPNGEYTHAFDDLKCQIKKFKVELTEEERDIYKELKVPAWLWNSYEWSSFSNASGRTQRPILRQALRELRSGATDGTLSFESKVRSHFSSCHASLRIALSSPSIYKDSCKLFGNKLKTISEDCEYFANNCESEELKSKLLELKRIIRAILGTTYFEFFDKTTGKKVLSFNPFSRENVENCINAIEELLENLGGKVAITGPNEDSPIPFDVLSIADHVEKLSSEANITQFIDFLIMRIRSMLADNRMNKIIADKEGTTLDEWLNEIMDGLSIIDLSLVPSEIIHLVVSVISRIVFETLQRYRRINNKLLPTVMVMEEAHAFIKRYNEGTGEEITASQLCTESFEKIAREGRKFGLSLTLSSQRPSELSPTVLSQCNTFLLHRIVNDRDQELIRRLVPDNIGGLLQELPILPTRKAILLGWASPLPILVEINELEKEHCPQSSDPDFWDVWIRKEEREANWKILTDDWQNLNNKEVDSNT